MSHSHNGESCTTSLQVNHSYISIGEAFSSLDESLMSLWKKSVHDGSSANVNEQESHFRFSEHKL